MLSIRGLVTRTSLYAIGITADTTSCPEVCFVGDELDPCDETAMEAACRAVLSCAVSEVNDLLSVF